MADKIPTEVRGLALSLHTDLLTLNTYAEKPDVAAALVSLIFDKIRTIGDAVISVADNLGVSPITWATDRTGEDKAQENAGNSTSEEV